MVDTIIVHPDEPINPDAAVGGATGAPASQYNLPYHDDGGSDGAGLYPNPTPGIGSGGAGTSPNNTAGQGSSGNSNGSGSGDWPALLSEMSTRIGALLLGLLLLILGLVWAMQKHS